MQPSYGYRAVHIIATAQGKPVEIQVRTELQHLWAQLSEKLSDEIDPGIKYGAGAPEVQDLLGGFSLAVGDLEWKEMGPTSVIARMRVDENRQKLRQQLKNWIGAVESRRRTEEGN